MTTEKTITVTDENIMNGDQNEASSCALALAMHDAGFEVVNVVYDKGIYYYGDKWSFAKPQLIEIPDEVMAFAKRFDNEGIQGVEPISFTINV